MDINNFDPFNSEVWGTFSDWAMVSVTGLTALLLLKTLRSQIKVQELQQKMFEI